MKHKWNGFTLVEVSIFIAISGLILVSVIGMASLAISQQRFNDTTQNFAEFLRSVYAGVENPQGVGDGRSMDYAIYGKLVTFGETVELDGISDVPSDTQRIFVYDVVGEDNYDGTGEIINEIQQLNMDAVLVQKNSDGEDVVVRAGIVESYTPRWSAVIDSTVNGVPFAGSLLIIKNPRTGVITTLVAEGSRGVVQINKAFKKGTVSVDYVRNRSLLVKEFSNFEIKEVNFCVNMNGYGKRDDRRQDVRIAKDARNASGVSIIGMDSEENACNK